MDGITCVTCGGAEFFLSAGFYFCSECQTQAAGLQEQDFEQPDETIVVSTAKKIKSSSSDKTPKADQITSWECYNYILLGLVNELIELGAHKNLKPIVQTIWFTYLKKIEVIHVNVNQPPNLPAFNHKHDAKIIFGRCRKKKTYKRKRTLSCSSAGSVSNSESTVSRREQNRLKRLMAKAIYDSQQSQHSTQNSESSLLNHSLGSLKSNTSDTQKENFLNFSSYAKSELQNHMTKTHLLEHIEDVDVALNCHNLSYRNITCSYKKTPTVMTQTKLYAILYLALLINKDEIHLGDMIRFMNEGSLSYNYYQHFFPEDIDSQTSFLNSFKISRVYKHDTYRAESGKLAAFLDLNDDIPIPNMVNLIKRYCKEMNLPNEICSACLNFLAFTQPNMKIINNIIPNYEGKAMCVIIFVLKLLFGLDDVTELHLSSFADKINEGEVPQDNKHADRAEMFSFMDWLKTILYRRHVLSKHHFPTGFVDKVFSTQVYIDFINAYYHKYDIQRQEDHDYDNVEKVVGKDVDLKRQTLIFTPSLTPLYDNLKVLLNSGELNNYQREVVLRNYEYATIHHLKEPKEYFTRDTEIINKGANNDIKLSPIFATQNIYLNGRNTISCKVSKGKTHVPNVNAVEDELDTQLRLNFFDRIYADNLDASLNRSFNECGLAAQVYNKHYRPDRRYWLRLGVNIFNMRIDEFEKFWCDFPYHFRLLVGECAKITSQGVKDLMVEFNYFDCYVCYEHLFDEDGKMKKSKSAKNSHLNVSLIRLVKIAKQHW